ncbi:MAG: hypothetical protein ACK56I_00880, partial [bacterium]
CSGVRTRVFGVMQDHGCTGTAVDHVAAVGIATRGIHRDGERHMPIPGDRQSSPRAYVAAAGRDHALAHQRLEALAGFRMRNTQLAAVQRQVRGIFLQQLLRNAVEILHVPVIADRQDTVAEALAMRLGDVFGQRQQ